MNKKQKIDELMRLVGGTDRKRYEEGRNLVHKVNEKLAEKYGLTILCNVTRADQPDNSQLVLNMSPEIMANVIAAIFNNSNPEGRKLTKTAMGILPDIFWVKALGFRFVLFYVALGAGAWALFADILLPAAIRAVRGF